MQEPKLEDYNLNPEKLIFLDSFSNTIKRKDKWWKGIFTIIFLTVYVFFMWQVAHKPREEVMGNGSWLLFYPVLWYFPFLLAESVGKIVNSFFLSFSDEYKSYGKIKEDKGKYEEQLKEYNKYINEVNKENERKAEEIRKKNARKIISENLEYLPGLKEKIFNKRITHDDLLELKDTLSELMKWRKYMTWDEYYNNYCDFEKYLRQRERQLNEQKYISYSEKKDKESEEIIMAEVEDIGNNTKKITIDTLMDANNEDADDNDITQRTFEGKKVDFEEVNKENTSLGLKGEIGILNYEKEILIRNKRGDLAEKVKHVSEEDGAGTGYDISSFYLDGQPKYIEVKTTKGSRKTPFILSENEVAFMEHEPKNCSIYRLYNFDIEKETGDLIIANGYEEIMHKFNLKASQYKAKIK